MRLDDTPIVQCIRKLGCYTHRPEAVDACMQHSLASRSLDACILRLDTNWRNTNFSDDDGDLSDATCHASSLSGHGQAVFMPVGCK